MTDRLVLVGDNPFHGVSHLSQKRSLLRPGAIRDAGQAARLVASSVNHGADGFTFTVSATTLAILNDIGACSLPQKLELYPLIPDVNNMVRTAGAGGGIIGLAKSTASKMAGVLNFGLLLDGAGGLVRNNTSLLFRAYLKYEYLQLQRIVRRGKNLSLAAILLHEIVTDMALALDMGWLFRTHIELMKTLGIKPGFETRNLPYLVKQFKKWGIDFRGIVIEAPFNMAGFQMCPSRADCENALAGAAGSEVIAFSILAAGYLKLPQALDYIDRLDSIRGIAIGVSSEKQAAETFSAARESFLKRN